MNIIKDNIFRILISKKTFLYIILNFGLSLLIGLLLSSESGLMIDHLNGSINKLGLIILNVNLGLLLWLFIFFYVVTYFSVNFENGILLNQLTKSISRNKFYIYIYLSIIISVFIITVINLLLSYGIVVILYDVLNIRVLKMLLSAIIFSLFHIIFITSLFMFIVILIRRVEAVIIVGIITALIFNVSVMATGILELSIINYEIFPFAYLYNDVFKVFIYDNNLISNNIESINDLTGYYQLFKDFDNELGFIPVLNPAMIRNFFFRSLFFVMILDLILVAVSMFRFKTMDIKG